jgi:hypothetical protein
MTELLIGLGLIAGVLVAHEIGFRLGSLTRSAHHPFDRQVGLVRTSTAALVAFLIGFAFSGAASRFIDRQDIIVKEANALGTAYLRADTIAEPQRSDLKAALKEYTAGHRDATMVLVAYRHGLRAAELIDLRVWAVFCCWSALPAGLSAASELHATNAVHHGPFNWYFPPTPMIVTAS